LNLESLLTARIAVNDLKSGDEQGAFLEVAEALAAAEIIKPDQCQAMRDAFVARERQGTTALGSGMAIPHVFVDNVPAAHLVVARSKNGVPMRAPDGKPIRLFFCIVACESARGQYLHMLKTIAKVARDAYWRRYLEKVSSATQIFDALIQGEKALSV
jgi:mannitol/fructose-specific phosphotransferase system IIA component (Ntr-type)